MGRNGVFPYILKELNSKETITMKLLDELGFYLVLLETRF